MATVREQILVAVEAALTAIDSGITVTRMRDIDFIPPALPAINLVDGTVEEIERGCGYDWYQINALVHGYVKDAAPSQLGPKISELAGRILIALEGSAALTALIVQMDVGAISATDTASDDPDTPNAAFEMPLSIDFWTKPRNPNAIGP